MPLGLSLSFGGSTQSSSQAVQGNRVTPYSNGHSVFVDGTETVKLLNQSQINTLIRGSFTWAFWYHDTSISTQDLGGINLATGQATHIRLRTLPVAPGVQFLQTVVTLNNSASQDVASIGTAIANNTWHHIAMTVQKGSGGANTGTIKVYIDGVEKQSFTGPSATNQEAADVQDDTTWGVGSAIDDDGNGSGFSSGFFDEVAFWDSVLPPDDIGTIYNSGNGTSDLTSDFGSYNSSSNLQYYFRFENDYTDTKGNASNATTEGSPVFSTSPTPP